MPAKELPGWPALCVASRQARTGRLHGAARLQISLQLAESALLAMRWGRTPRGALRERTRARRSAFTPGKRSGNVRHALQR